MSTLELPPAEAREDEGRLKLREALGHRWWGFVLAINFFFAPLGALALARIRFTNSPAGSFIFLMLTVGSVLTLVWFMLFIWKRPPHSGVFWVGTLAAVFTVAGSVAYSITRTTTLPDLSPLFWYLTLVILAGGGLFALFVRVYARTAYRLKVGDEMREEVPPERWQKSRWAERADALWHGLVRLEFFGWVIWVTSAVAAIGGALRHPPLSDPPFSELSVLNKYFRTLDTAAFDLIRATVIGTIVLFFVQLLKTYQDAIIAAGKAAKDAEQASQRARDAISRADKILPALSQQMNKAIDLFKTAGNYQNANLIAANFAQSLRIISESGPALAHVRELSERVFEHVGLINREINQSSALAGKPPDYFDLASLSAIYSTYLRVESLSFEGDADSGLGGYRLSTRYPHYALAVRSVVDAITQLDPTHERYKFYTIFSREPERFFNPKPGRSQTDVTWPQVSINWTTLFLERFCRWQNRMGIPYTRHFVTCGRNSSGSRSPIPPLSAVVDEQLEKYVILCNVKDGRRRPLLWGEAAWEFFECDEAALTGQSVWSYLSEDEARGLKAAVRQVIPPPAVREALGAVDFVRQLTRPSYLIVGPDKRKSFDGAIRQHEQEIEFRPLREILHDYHSQTCPPVKLVFERDTTYESFFSDKIPRDLLAVWDAVKQCWCLCIGTMIGEEDPSAIVMVVTTKDRPLKNLPWSELEDKLSTLFCTDTPSGNEKCQSLIREQL